MNIFCDVDGVLVNYQKQFIKFYNQENGLSLDYRNYDEYDLSKTLNMVGDRFRYLRDEFFYEDIDFFENSIRVLNSLRVNGFKVYFCTTCVTEESLIGKHRLLQRNFKWYDLSNFICMKNKNFINLDEPFVFIEDHPNKTKNINGVLIGFKQPYNRELEEDVSLYTNDWEEIGKFIKTFNFAKIPLQLIK